MMPNGFLIKHETGMNDNRNGTVCNLFVYAYTCLYLPYGIEDAMPFWVGPPSQVDPLSDRKRLRVRWALQVGSRKNSMHRRFRGNQGITSNFES